MTTLEDVFLRLEAETEVDQAGKCVTQAQQDYDTMKMPALEIPDNPGMSSDYSVFNQERADEECDSVSEDDTDQRLLMFSDGKSDFVSGHTLWRQQFSTIACLHMLNMRRERKAFIYT